MQWTCIECILKTEYAVFERMQSSSAKVQLRCKFAALNTHHRKQGTKN